MVAVMDEYDRRQLISNLKWVGLLVFLLLLFGVFVMLFPGSTLTPQAPDLPQK